MFRLLEVGKIVKYALVGGINTGVDFTVFCLLVYGAGAATIAAQITAYSMGLISSFLLNRNWTFQMKTNKVRGQLLRFLIINALSFAMATVLLLSLENAGMNSAGAKLFSVGCSLVINYLGYRVWVFRRVPQPK